MRDRLYSEFFDPSKQFLREPRAFCYDVAASLIRQARKADSRNWQGHPKTAQAIFLLLQTWNAAGRAKQRTPSEIGKLISQRDSDLRSLAPYSLMTIPDSSWPIVRRIFRTFKASLGQTGASKALSLINPRLFVMWDTRIRARLNRELIKGLGNGKRVIEYQRFLQGLRKIVDDYSLDEKLPKRTIIAKKLDEYHFVRIILRRANG